MTGDREGVWDAQSRQNWLVFFSREKQRVTLLRTGTHASLGIA